MRRHIADRKLLPRLWLLVFSASLAAQLQAESTDRTTLTRTHADFCAEVQRLLVPSALPIDNVIEPDFEAFKRSKPAADPLTTHQYLTPADSTRPAQLSCKTKSADHLRAVYGSEVAAAPPSASQPELTCRDVHRAMVMALWGRASPAERAAATYPPHRVRLAADSTHATGSSWVQSTATAEREADGRLQLRSSRLFVGWDDWRWKLAPDSFRGNHYCHLVSPENLRALMWGDQ